jgi:hypothetical protein
VRVRSDDTSASSPVTRRIRRGVSGAAALSAAAALLVACTSSSSPSTSTSGAKTGGTAGTTAGPASGTTSGGSVSSSTPKSTPVPTATVPSIKVTSKSPVPISSPAGFGTGVVAHVTAVRAVQGHPVGPGEVAGPAVAVYITLDNGNSKAAPVQPVVNLYYGAAHSPANPISGSPAKPFPSSLPAQGSVRGVYVFTVPTAQRRHVVVEVSYNPGAPFVRFAGPV